MEPHLRDSGSVQSVGRTCVRVEILASGHTGVGVRLQSASRTDSSAVNSAGVAMHLKWSMSSGGRSPHITWADTREESKQRKRPM